MSGGDGTLTEFDGSFEVASHEPTVGCDADGNRIAIVRTGPGEGDRSIGPDRDLGMHASERILPEPGDQA